MPPSGCGQIAEFAIEYANFSLFQYPFLRTRFFQKSPTNRWLSQRFNDIYAVSLRRVALQTN
jgi:hypothetical protein